MQCYAELAPPTAVTHSVSLALTSPTAHNLVIAKGSVLQIFTTKIVSSDSDIDDPAAAGAQDATVALPDDDDGGVESSFLGPDTALLRPDRVNLTKLVLVAEIPVAGTVSGLARVTLPPTFKAPGDALLIAYRGAKMVLATWDAEQLTLNVLSLHYYEKDDKSGSPWEPSLADNAVFLEADPGSRCAALKFGARSIAILPFKARADDDDDENMGDDWDEDLDGPRPEKPAKTAEAPAAADAANGTAANSAVDTPYTSSFVLPLPQIDHSLVHPVHLAFLHQYREPTFGILSSAHERTFSSGRRDDMTYKVFTLDLQQKASTAILSVENLPADLFRIVPLPSPAGGALLIGFNELIHVDQSGRTNGVAVNTFAKLSGGGGVSLVDMSELDLRLEGCRLEVLSAETGELLMVLGSGRLAIVSLRIDGRTVSGLSVRVIGPETGGALVKTGVSCMSRIGKHSMFLGSTGGDSTVLGWTRKQGQAARRKSRLLDTSFEYDLEDLDLEDDDDEDDLYGDSGGTTSQSNAANNAHKPGGDVILRIHDTLFSIAPIHELTPGRPVFPPDSEEQKNAAGVVSDLHLTLAVGRDQAGAMAIMNREIQPRVVGRFEFPETRGFWTMCVQKPVPKILQGDKEANVRLGEVDLSGQFDKLMIVAKVDLDGYETSDVYALTAAGFEAMAGTEFEPAAGITVEAGTMGNHNRIVQVLRAEVRCYDGDLGLSQIIPMLDEETGAEPRVLSASIGDPYLLLIRDDASVMVIRIDANNELEEMEKPEKLATTKWAGGCLYVDAHCVFGDKSDQVFMFLQSTAGSLVVYSMSDLSTPVYIADALTIAPPYLTPDFAVRKGTARESLSEILVADLGDQTHSSPYLILRHKTNDLTIYEPIRTSSSQPLASSLRFKKCPNPVLAKRPPPPPPSSSDDDAPEPLRFVPLRRCADISGYTTVFLPGPSPAFILKSARSVPRVVGLHGLPVRAMSTFHTEGCERGFIYADANGIARVTQLPRGTNFTALGIPARKIPLGFDVRSIAHHPTTDTYVVAGSEHVKLDPAHETPDPDTSVPSMFPHAERAVIKLISPITWTVIHSMTLDPFESIECMRTLSLEVSEETKERRLLIAVGTSLTRGEDLPVRGRILILDVVPVIPLPDRPETDRRLRQIAREEIPRGAVTSVSEIGTSGLMLVAQGQKCMVRGLKEDGSLLPVAFLDMSCYVTSVTELAGSGLCVMSDALRGVWFAGYTEEPFRMMVLGKSASKVKIVTTEFLPFGKELVIIAADVDGDVHVLEFNPEDPKSIQGHLLLHRTTFSTHPNIPTRTLLLPTSHTNFPPNTQTIMLSSPTGQLASITPLPESLYRRLSSISTQLSTAVPANGGLSIKGHRVPGAVNGAGTGGGGGGGASGAAKVGITSVSSAGRNMIDATVLTRWGDVAAGKRAEIAGRGGYDVAGGGGIDGARSEVRSVVGWAGLDYF